MNKLFGLTFILSAFQYFTIANDYNPHLFKPTPIRSGPWIQMTKGEVWPKPKLQVKKNQALLVESLELQYELNEVAKKCNLVTKALDRFRQRFATMFSMQGSQYNYNHTNAIGILKKIGIHQEGHCEQNPHAKMLEKYHLRVFNTPNGIGLARIVAKSTWGILRGLQSLSQLFYRQEINSTWNQAYTFINLTDIIDKPAYSHRGLMLDTSRHFLCKKVLLHHLDLMEINKLNVFHWHITDDTSFPFVSKKYPELSLKGAFHPITHVYEPEDIKDLIEYARERGIRIIAEFDTPSHCNSWKLGYPEIFLNCKYLRSSAKVASSLDITKESTFEFISNLYDEIFEVFPDEMIHLGGDEAQMDYCWNRHFHTQYLAKKLALIGNYTGLQNYYFEKLNHILVSKALKRTFIVWEDAFESFSKMSQDIIVQVWKDWGLSLKNQIDKILQRGNKIILSSPWYLDHIYYGSDWVKFYNLDFEIITNQTLRSLILGGEICIWGEFVNSFNSISVTWPRSSAPAEILWTGKADEFDFAARRLQEHECRMIGLGFQISPIVGAGFCEKDIIDI